MSLATLRTHVWKGGSDIVLYYKANGRKEICPATTTQNTQPEGTDGGVASAPLLPVPAVPSTGLSESSNATQA